MAITQAAIALNEFVKNVYQIAHPYRSSEFESRLVGERFEREFVTQMGLIWPLHEDNRRSLHGR